MKTRTRKFAALCLAAVSGLSCITAGLTADSFGVHAASYIPTLDSDGYYAISTAEQLDWFAEEVNSGNTDINGKLTADIVYNDGLLDEDGNLNSGSWNEWTPIGYYSTNTFEGNFNGYGYTISGLYCEYTTNEYLVGLFGGLDGSSQYIQNVTVEDSYFYSAGGYVGGIVANVGSGSFTRISQCTVRDSYIATSQTGTYAGYAYAYACAGGIVGFAGSYAAVTACENDNSFVEGEVSGGIVGASRMIYTYTTYTANNMTNKVNVKGYITYCHNSGNISAYLYGGGILGTTFGGDVYVYDCYNNGDIGFYNDNEFATGYGFGGIVGRIGGQSGSYSSGDDLPYFAACYTNGTISGTSSTNGLLGTYEIGSQDYSTASEVVEGLFAKNCYYLSDTSTGSRGRTATEFATGEFCWELGSSSSTYGWVQTIGTETYPSLNYFSGNTDVVYRVEWDTDDTFDETQANTTYYTYMNEGTPTPPEELIEDGYTYHYYETTTSGNLAELNLADITVSSNDYVITVSRAAQIQTNSAMLSAMGGAFLVYGTVGVAKTYGAGSGGTPLSAAISNSSSLGTLTYTVDNIPEGLTLDSSNGWFTGTPTVAYPDGLLATATITSSNGESIEIPVKYIIYQVDPTDNITVKEDDDTTYYDGDALPDPDDILSSGDIEGTFEWVDVDDDATLDAGDNDLTWQFTPDDDNYATVTGTVTITALPSVVVATATTTLNGAYGEELEADMSEYVYNADEVDGVTFDVDELPEGLDLDAKTGVISGTPTVIYPDGFASVVTVIAGNGDTAELPIIFVISMGTVEVSEADADEIYYDGDAVPDIDDVLSADVAGTFEWVDVAEDATLSTGENELQWKFTPDDTDNYGVVTGTTVITANANVSVATFTTTLIAEYGEEVSKDMSEYVYNADEVGGVTFSSSTLPTGLTLDSETGLISGIPTALYTDGLEVTITVTAGNGSVDTIDMTAIITKADPTDGIAVNTEVTDDSIYYEGDAVPDVDDVLSSDIPGTFEWITDQDTLDAGENELQWKFTPDDTDHYQTVTGTVTIDALAVVRVATSTTTLNGEYGKEFTAEMSAYVYNADEVDGVTYSVDALPKGLTLDSATGTISGIPTSVYTDGFDSIITVTAGNGSIATMNIEIIITKINANITVSDAVDGTYYDGDPVPDIDDVLSADVAGTFEWVDVEDGATLSTGENELQWKFTPDDTDHYAVATGTVTITAEEVVTTTTTETTTATTTESTTTESTTTTTTATESTSMEATTTEATTTITETTTTSTTTTTESTTTTTETTTTTTSATTTSATTTTTTTTETTTTTTTMTTTTVTESTTTTTESTTTTTTTETTTTKTETTTTTTETTTTTTTTTTTESTTTTTNTTTTTSAATISTTEKATTTTTVQTKETTTATTATTALVTTTESTKTTTTENAETDTDTETEPLAKGDVDLNGAVEITDASRILTYYANLAAGNEDAFDDDEELNARILAEAADIDEDGLITINDASLTLVYYANHAAGVETTWEQLLSDRVDSYK